MRTMSRGCFYRLGVLSVGVLVINAVGSTVGPLIVSTLLNGTEAVFWVVWRFM